MHPLIVPLTSPEATDVDRFGPKAANLARLGRAGLPIPDGFCVNAEAYRIQVAALGLTDSARGVKSAESATARRAVLAMKLGLYDQPIVAEVLDPLLDAWRALVKKTGALTVVRSSALVEDRFGSSFAGQFESYLGLETEADFVTAVRSCWAALWSTRVLRYMATHDASPADTAMSILVQPLVSARVAGGGLSRTADGDMVLNATWGLGSAIAQGEVVPDRIVLRRDGQGELTLRDTVLGRKFHRVGGEFVPTPEPVCETGRDNALANHSGEQQPARPARKMRRRIASASFR
jgi:phosphoenolpyruvate synthase/pyruvate phosphate dikinase